MSGATPNVSRDFWAIEKDTAFLAVQQGLPSFDAVLNYQFQQEYWIRSAMSFWQVGAGIFGENIDTARFNLTEAAAPANDFSFGTEKCYVSFGFFNYWGQGPGKIEYASTDNYLFNGVVDAILADIIDDPSKDFKASHYLLESGGWPADGHGPCLLYMLSGAAAGNSYPITAYTATSVTATGASAGGVLADDTYRILPPVLTKPVGSDRDDDVVLMMFQDFLDETEDPDLEDPLTNLTEAQAFAMRWCVRVDQDQVGSMPSVSPENFFFPIARLERLDGNDNITTAMIVDDPQGAKMQPLAGEVKSLKAGTLMNKIVTVAVDTYPVDLADYTGLDALHDAVSANAAGNATIYVVGNAGGTPFDWTSKITVTGKIEIVAVGNGFEVEYDISAADYILETSGTGKVAIRGYAPAGAKGAYFIDIGSDHQAFKGVFELGHSHILGGVLLLDDSSVSRCEFDGQGYPSGSLALQGERITVKDCEITQPLGTTYGLSIIGTGSTTALQDILVENVRINMSQGGAEATPRQGLHLDGTNFNNGFVTPPAVILRNIRIYNIPVLTVASNVGIVNLSNYQKLLVDNLQIDGDIGLTMLRQPLIGIEGLHNRSEVEFRNTDLMGGALDFLTRQCTVAALAGDDNGLVRVEFNQSLLESDMEPIVIFRELYLRQWAAGDPLPSVGVLITGSEGGRVELHGLRIGEWESISGGGFFMHGIRAIPTSVVRPVTLVIRDYVMDHDVAMTYFNGVGGTQNNILALNIGGANDAALILDIDGMAVKNVENDPGTLLVAMKAIVSSVFPLKTVVRNLYADFAEVDFQTAGNADGLDFLLESLHLHNHPDTAATWLLDITSGSGDARVSLSNCRIYGTGRVDNQVGNCQSTEITIAGLIMRTAGGAVTEAFNVTNPVGPEHGSILGNLV